LGIERLTPSSSLWCQGQAIGIPGSSQAAASLIDNCRIDGMASIPRSPQAFEIIDLVNTLIVTFRQIRIKLERLEPNLEVSLALELWDDSFNATLGWPSPISVGI
jgi:hypothetical protein